MLLMNTIRTFDLAIDNPRHHYVAAIDSRGLLKQTTEGISKCHCPSHCRNDNVGSMCHYQISSRDTINFTFTNTGTSHVFGEATHCIPEQWFIDL